MTATFCINYCTYYLLLDNAKFWSVAVQGFTCLKQSEVYVHFTIKINGTGKAIVFKTALENEIADGILDGTGLRVDTSLKDGWVKQNPKVFAVMKTKILNHHYCVTREEFKKKLAARIIYRDGVKRASPSQILIFDHKCNDKNSNYKKAEFRFYVSTHGSVVVANGNLTKLAVKIIDQMVYDGSAWKLGVVFHKEVSLVLF